jgi:hypothetical protein
MAQNTIAATKAKRKRQLALNERGRRIGESRPRAKFTDYEIHLMRELLEDELDAKGKLMLKGLTYPELADKFEAMARKK